MAGHSELMWLLGCYTPMGWLQRMTQWKVSKLCGWSLSHGPAPANNNYNINIVYGIHSPLAVHNVHGINDPLAIHNVHGLNGPLAVRNVHIYTGI